MSNICQKRTAVCLVALTPYYCAHTHQVAAGSGWTMSSTKALIERFRSSKPTPRDARSVGCHAPYYGLSLGGEHYLLTPQYSNGAQGSHEKRREAEGDVVPRRRRRGWGSRLRVTCTSQVGCCCGACFPADNRRDRSDLSHTSPFRVTCLIEEPSCVRGR